MHAPRRQSGMTLIVVVLLLLLAGVLGLFALHTGMFEQKVSGNDLRAKLVDQIAEAGLSQGMEYLRQHPEYLTDSGKWTPCQATDRSFPCGSVEPAKASSPRRGTMYYWSTTGYDFDASGAKSGWETRMLPLDATGNVIASTGNNMPVRYAVGAVLCRMAFKTNATDPTTCVDFGAANVSGSSVITLVSVGEMNNEGSRATMVQSIGASNPLNGLASAPPILASGSVDVTGGLQVVTNPNAGGTGVPVSVWTRKDVSKTGTPNTCYYNEFLHNSSGGTNGTVYLDTASPNFPLCDNCKCNGADSLSYTNSGNKVDAGIDILQNSGVNSNYSAPLQAGYANYDVKPQEFPCDLFQQVFGTQAWQDNDGDSFCETKVMATFKNPNSGATVTMGADEAFLFTFAKTIIPSAATTAANLATAAQLALPGTYPSSSFSGIVWCQANCDVGANKQLGTPANPVLLVVDDASGFKIQGKVFGLVFVRSLAGTATLTPSTGYTMTSSQITNGGTASVSMNAGAVVYGAVVVQGKVAKANGTASVVYNQDVLTTLTNGGSTTTFVGVPGSWTDSVSY